MRDRISQAMKEALKSKDQKALATIRLISAALKDRDIAARSQDNAEGISDDEILSLLQTMIKQRSESAKLYLEGNRPELAEAEQHEISIIQQFLPEQLDEAAIRAAIKTALAETGSSSVKDMGTVMNYLKTQFAGQMDFSMASQLVKKALLES
jgi:uncharacterized protein YqeY